MRSGRDIHGKCTAALGLEGDGNVSGDVTFWGICPAIQLQLIDGTVRPATGPLQIVSWAWPSTLSCLKFPHLTWEEPTRDVIAVVKLRCLQSMMGLWE